MAKRAHGPCSISSCSLLQLTGFASLLLSLYLLFFCLWLIFLLLRPFNHFLFILLSVSHVFFLFSLLLFSIMILIFPHIKILFSRISSWQCLIIAPTPLYGFFVVPSFSSFWSPRNHFNTSISVPTESHLNLPGVGSRGKFCLGQGHTRYSESLLCPAFVELLSGQSQESISVQKRWTSMAGEGWCVRPAVGGEVTGNGPHADLWVLGWLGVFQSWKSTMLTITGQTYNLCPLHHSSYAIYYCQTNLPHLLILSPLWKPLQKLQLLLLQTSTS